MQKSIHIPTRTDRPHSRNVMPSGYQKSIGPFIYFDHIGPYEFPQQFSVHIPPHPHAGISTISYMLAGEGHHKDSIGNDLVLESGRLNWMNAGNGIIHSEGTSGLFAKKGGKLLGFQIWILGSDDERSKQATFQSFSKEELPSTGIGNSKIQLLAGKYNGLKSPIQTNRELVLFIIKPVQDEIILPLQPEWEYLIYSLEGSFSIADNHYGTGEGIVIRQLKQLKLLSSENCDILVLGGMPLEKAPVFSGSLVAGSLEELEFYEKKLLTEGFGKI